MDRYLKAAEKSFGILEATTGAKAPLILGDIRGPKGPLFHGIADSCFPQPAQSQ
jgi:hypothetical protein